jgi:hypothetical protein
MIGHFKNSSVAQSMDAYFPVASLSAAAIVPTL